MYKQSNISVFVITSLVLHFIFFSQYQWQSQYVFDHNSEDISFANKVIKLNFLSGPVAKPVVNESIPVIENNHISVPKSQPVLNLKASNSMISPVKSKKKKITKKIIEDNGHKKLQQKDSQSGEPLNERNLYLEKIIKVIEINKFYPVSARKRNMQERIGVAFDLLENGKVDNLIISGRYKILRHAARMAILNAVPFPASSEYIRFPFHIKYLMAFKLE